MFNGHGAVKTEKNHQMFGLFVMGKLQGKAIYKTDTTDYVGEFKNNKAEGKGRRVVRNGERVIKIQEGSFTGNEYIPGTGVETEEYEINNNNIV